MESDVESSDTLVLANNPMNLSINFYSNTFTCGYVQWYYSLGNSVPYALIAIPNSNNNNISFSPPDTGYIWIRATGLFGGNGDFFFTRGTSFYVQKCDSCGHTSDTTSTGGGTEPKPDILSYHSESKNQSVHTETNVNTSAKNTEVQVEPVKVYPNPFRDQLHIGSQNTDNTSICIFDVNGKKVLEELLDGDQGISSINTTSLAPGTYFLRISSDEENSIHTLIKSEK